MDAVLTSRDREVLSSIHEHRCLTSEQIERLHFPSAQTTRRRLRALAQNGLIRCFRSPALTHRLISLTPRGVVHVCEGGNEPRLQAGGDVRSALFIEHLVAVNDFRIALKLACRARPEVECLGFLPEFLMAPCTNGGRPQPYIADVAGEGPALVRHTPDGVFGLKRGDKAALFLLEVDRGTEVVGHPERGVGKLVRYHAGYLTGNRFQRYASDFGLAEAFRGFRLLLVTTTGRRVASIRQRCSRIPGVPERAMRFLWITDTSVLRSSDPLTHPWRSLDAEDSTEYRIAPDREPTL